MSCRMMRSVVLMTALTMAVSGTDAKEAAEVEVALSDCPAAVQQTFKRETHGANLKEVEKNTAGGKTIYEAEIEIDDNDYELKVAEDGTLLCKRLDNEDDELREERNNDDLDLSDCPPAVRETMKRESLGAELDEIEREREHGQVVYEADVKIDGNNYEIVVANNGTLISKALVEHKDEEDDGDVE